MNAWKPLHWALVVVLVGCAPSGRDDTSAVGPDGKPLRAPDVRYEPTPQSVVPRILDLAAVRAGDVVYDLGSGDGRIVIAAARDRGAQGVGIDIDPQRIAEARANARAAGLRDEVSFRNEDLFVADFSDATVVTLFLYPDVNLKLKPRLVEQLHPGTRVVSYHHDMGCWQAERTVRVRGAPIYLWTMPARPDAVCLDDVPNTD